jgi:hypothetical protein
MPSCRLPWSRAARQGAGGQRKAMGEAHGPGGGELPPHTPTPASPTNPQWTPRPMRQREQSSPTRGQPTSAGARLTPAMASGLPATMIESRGTK